MSRSGEHRATPAEIDRLIERAVRHDITLSASRAKTLASHGLRAALRSIDDAAYLMRVARDEDIVLSFEGAIWRLRICGGVVDEAIRRTIAGGAELRAGVTETVAYAAARGIVLQPNSVHHLFRRHGRPGTRRYVDDLAEIMDAAARLGIECPQTLASHRLSRADGDAQRVIDEFAAEHRRRADRLTVRCRVTAPPHNLAARSNAFAGCGCPRCRQRLAEQMTHYIAKMIAGPFFSRLDPDEARAEANLELIRSIDSWPGGNFTGWFAARFKHRVQQLYSRRRPEEDQMLSLDAAAVLANDDGGRMVPLGERIPDRTVDVAQIVLLRERVSEAALALRQIRAERGRQYTDREATAGDDDRQAA
jgi:hypothetical protein